MSELVIAGLHASAGGKEILRGLDLTVRSGEVHAIMGPNGAGKSTLSHVLMGKPGYDITAGSVTLDGVDLLTLAPHERAHAGLFLAMQYPTEVPGVSIEEMLTEALIATGHAHQDMRTRLVGEAARIGFDERFLDRAVNVDFSGGEKKRNETLQMAMLQPKIAILDELDSGLDVDALRLCSRRVEAATHEDGLGVIAITHYKRLLDELRPDFVHVLAKGSIQLTGGFELAEELERTGYAQWIERETVETRVSIAGFGDDPFA